MVPFSWFTSKFNSFTESDLDGDPGAEDTEFSEEPDSGIYKVRETLHVALHPRYLHNLQLGLLSYFNKKISVYDAKLDGILAAYGKIYLRSPNGILMNEEAHIHVDVISDFWVFRPVIGAQLKGVVNKKSPSHVSCLIHGCFNVPCYRPDDTLASAWCGLKAKLKQVVRLTVQKIDLSQKIPFIMGSLQAESVDEKVMADGSAFTQVEEVAPAVFERVIKTSASDAEYDSGIDSAGKKRKATEEADAGDHTPTPKKKKRRKDKVKEEEVDLQNSLLESATKKMKKSKKDKRSPPVDLKPPLTELKPPLMVPPESIEETEPAPEEDNEAIPESPKKSKKKRKAKESTSEAVSGEKEAKRSEIMSEDTLVRSPTTTSTPINPKGKKAKKTKAKFVAIKQEAEETVDLQETTRKFEKLQILAGSSISSWNAWGSSLNILKDLAPDWVYKRSFKKRNLEDLSLRWAGLASSEAGRSFSKAARSSARL
eukprot:maker-scaffold143_size313727-snap-gene-1.25 protein:Tk09415 transcript:maker-scaffold143_size313727-snap-gene-1.25-mRNA-1 annotation:"hypothetical protein DAPPUDRAFT_59298"